MSKQALLLNVGGTIRQLVPEGIPSSATVIVYRQDGTVAAASAAATTSGRELSVAVSAEVCATEALNYRARWTYTVTGVSYVLDTLFDVARAVIRAPCGQGDFVAQYPILAKRFPSGMTSHASALSGAWDDILARVRAAGRDPNRIISPEAFRRAHATLAAAITADNLSVEQQEWGPKGEHWRRQAGEMVDQLLASVWWYDSSSDLVPGDDETGADLSLTVALR